MSDVNFYSKSGAEILVARIKAYWAGRGKSPHVWVEPLRMVREAKSEDAKDHTTILYCVKSNMLGGKPV